MSLAETAETLARIQAEQIPWQQHNFPERTEWQCLLGAEEEFHEAQDALGDRNEYLDAVADHSIFLIDLCTALGFQADVALRIGWDVADFEGRPWSRHLGKLTHHYLKLVQRIRGNADYHRSSMLNRIGCLFATLERDVELLGESYAATLAKTWDAVRARDWVRYPETGTPPANECEPVPICGTYRNGNLCVLPLGHEGDHAWMLREYDQWDIIAWPIRDGHPTGQGAALPSRFCLIKNRYGLAREIVDLEALRALVEAYPGKVHVEGMRV